MGAVRLSSGQDAGGFRHPVTHGGKNQPVIPPETFSATHGLQQKQRKQVPLNQGTAAGAKPYFMSTIVTTVRQKCWLVGGVVYHLHLSLVANLTVYEGAELAVSKYCTRGAGNPCQPVAD